MSLTLRDNIISALDDYAEYVLGSDFSGAITQEEAVDFILESIEKQGYMRPPNLTEEQAMDELEKRL